MILKRKYYTSTSFKLNAKIGRLRTNLADRLQNRLVKHYKRSEDFYTKANNMPGIKNRNLVEKSIAEAYNRYEAPTTLGMSSNVTKINTKGNSRSYNINMTARRLDDITAETHSHELGHILSDKKNSLFTRKGRDQRVRNKLQNSLNTSYGYKLIDDYKTNLQKEEKYPGNQIFGKINRARRNIISDLNNKGKLDTGTGIGESIKRMFEGNSVISEERSATKNGLRFLKKNNATKNELSDGRKKLKTLLQTYRENAKIHVLNPIQNKIQIPSRRRK